MNALVINNLVVDIVEEPFEVHSSMLWVECDVEVIIGDTYNNGIFTSLTKYIHTYSELREHKYPNIGDQLDALFHAGAFPPEMAAEIQAVKDLYPKPS